MPVPESLVVTQDEVLPSVCHNSTTTAVSAAVRASESLVVQSNGMLFGSSFCFITAVLFSCLVYNLLIDPAASSGVNVIQAEASPILLQKCTSSSVSSSAVSAPIRLLEKSNRRIIQAHCYMESFYFVVFFTSFLFTVAVPDFLSSMALPQDDSLIGSRSPKQANIFSTSTPLSDKNKGMLT